MRKSEVNITLKKNNTIISKVLIFIAPIVVLLVFTALYMVNGMYPFGDGTVVWCDMNQQVVPLLLQFKDMLSGNGSVMYSFSTGGGMNFWAVFLFFLSSPFSLLTAFIEKSDMLGAMNILVAIKLSVCALTAGVFFKYSQKGLHPVFTVVLSTMYAFCGYGMLFYQNIMWLDMMYLFPLLLLSFERIIYFQKPFLYILLMSAMVVVNFYIGYMVVLFTILFFGLYLVIVKAQKKKRVIAIFIFSSIIAGILTAIVWLPALVQYLNSGRGEGLLNSLMSATLFGYPETTISVLLCSGFMFAVIAFALIKKQIKNKQQVLYGVLFVFTLVPIFLEPINKMWHTGDYMCFPVRYGFITIFIGLALAGTLLSKIKVKEFPQKTEKITIVGLLLCGVVISVLSVFFYKSFYTYLTAYVTTLWGDTYSILLLLGYFIVIGVFYYFVYWLFSSKKITFMVFTVVLSVVLLTDICFNANVYIISAKQSTDTNAYNQMIALSDKIDDTSFYRVATDQKRFAVNYLSGLGYNCLSHYTSLTSKDYLVDSKKLGYSTYWMEVGGYGGTKLTDAIMSIKYNITHNNGDDNAIYRNQLYEIVPNSFYLPLGIITDTNISECPLYLEDDRAKIQDYLYKTLFNTDTSLITEYQPTQKQNCDISIDSDNQYNVTSDLNQKGILYYDVKVKGTKTLYLDCFHNTINDIEDAVNGSIKVSVNNKEVVNKYPQRENNGLLCLGTFTDQDVSIKIDLLKDFSCNSFGVFSLDDNILKKSIENTDTLNINIKNNSYAGSYTADREKYVFLSVPYDAGFTLTINGEQADYFKTSFNYIGFKINKGENNVNLSYIPNGMKLGGIISGIGLVLLLAFIAMYKKQKFMFNSKVVQSRAINAVYIMYAVAFFASVLAVYLFPMIVFVVKFFI